jgi:hypothetical protein
MLRRIYVLPLNTGLTADQAAEVVTAFDESDRYIAGLIDSAAGIDLDTRTVVWEMSFPQEEAYLGPYMVHPYHIGTLDNYLLRDSPERMTHDFTSARYRVADSVPRLEAGVRRVILLELPDGTDTSAIEALTAPGGDVATSTFGADDIAWKGSKGRTWTHVWEQGFTDMAALERYLRTPAGVATANKDGFRYLGVKPAAVQVLTYPFTLKPAPAPAEIPADGPLLYTITARTAAEDADAFIDMLVRDYDPALARVGGKLLHRWRTVDAGYLDTEVQSTWELDSLSAFRDFRQATVGGGDPSWNQFVTNGMPLVKDGTRRFYRTV